jgi:hypothetical protein
MGQVYHGSPGAQIAGGEPALEGTDFASAVR